MNIYKRQSIQKLIVDQAGSERLILNDLILGRDGAQALSQLIPQYHTGLLHLEIKGNNIDSEGFELIFSSLMHCPNLVSILAQWNNIGSSPAGLMALLYLVRNLRFLQMIDLKNNKISHQSAELIAQIIKTNNRSLKVLDLRWNQIGEVGAQIIYPTISFNAALKFIGLEDNRISTNSLQQINDLLKNTSRGTLNLNSGTVVNPSPKANFTQNFFPITDDSYPSMEAQMKTGQLRTKIDNEQQEAVLQQEKIQLEIQKVIQKIRIKGGQIHETQLKYDILNTQNVNIINHLREAERLLTLEKEKFFGLDKNLNSDKSAIRSQKFHLNAKIQVMMQKTVQRHQRELDDLSTVMAQKYDRLQIFLKDRLNEKRQNREKLSEIKEDIIKFKMSKESIWDKLTLSSATAHKNSWEEECQALEELIGKAEANVKSERKKGEYLSEELTNFVMRGLKRQEKFEKDIYEIQNKIKDLHKEMTLANVQIEENHCKITLKEAQIIEKQASVDLNRRYVKYIQSQNSVNIDIERLKNDQDAKADRLGEQTIELRINDLERAVRMQQSQNKMIKNHYEKVLAQLEALTKNAIQAVLFEG